MTKKKEDRETPQTTVEKRSLTMLAVSYLSENLWEHLKVKFCFAPPSCHQFLSYRV